MSSKNAHSQPIEINHRGYFNLAQREAKLCTTLIATIDGPFIPEKLPLLLHASQNAYSIRQSGDGVSWGKCRPKSKKGFKPFSANAPPGMWRRSKCRERFASTFPHPIQQTKRRLLRRVYTLQNNRRMSC